MPEENKIKCVTRQDAVSGFLRKGTKAPNFENLELLSRTSRCFLPSYLDSCATEFENSSQLSNTLMTAVTAPSNEL